MTKYNGVSETDTERITCAAIWYKDLPDSVFKPTNIDKGIVVCGHRHGNCIDTVKSLSGQVYRNFLDNPRIGLFSEDLY